MHVNTTNGDFHHFINTLFIKISEYNPIAYKQLVRCFSLPQWNVTVKLYPIIANRTVSWLTALFMKNYQHSCRAIDSAVNTS